MSKLITENDLKNLLDEILPFNYTDLYTVTKSVTFSSGTATVTEQGVTTSTRVIPTRCVGTTSSIMVTAKVTADNTISMAAYNCQSSGSTYSGTTDVTLLIDNR